MHVHNLVYTRDKRRLAQKSQKRKKIGCRIKKKDAQNNDEAWVRQRDRGKETRQRHEMKRRKKGEHRCLVVYTIQIQVMQKNTNSIWRTQCPTHNRPTSSDSAANALLPPATPHPACLANIVDMHIFHTCVQTWSRNHARKSKGKWPLVLDQSRTVGEPYPNLSEEQTDSWVTAMHRRR